MIKKVNRVLLTNDDGIDAPGLELLARAAQEIAHEVWIVAPAQDQSGVANAFSARGPVRITHKAPRRIAVGGTPTDCVAFALQHAMRDAQPDLVLSGVNNGSNIGFETLLSGTVGAAMTGMLCGIPSIALSQNRDPDREANWDSTTRFLVPTLQHLLAGDWDRRVCLNVNFPDLPADGVKGIRVTTQGIGKVNGMMVVPAPDPHGEEYYWIRVRHEGLPRTPSSELKANEDGFISVTPLTFERTEMQEYRRLTDVYGQDF